MVFSRRIWFLIISSLCIRLFIANVLELGNDEVYYYTYALHLQWNYFDHPPGIALLIKVSTLNLLFTNEVFVRLGAIICAAAGTWLSYNIGILIRNERTGFYAAVLYNTSIYTSIIAGTFILPDSPQIVFWLAALFVMIKMIVRYENTKHIPVFYWLMLSLLSGLCILCKIHGIFLWVGLILYMSIYNRKIFLHPEFYLSFILTLIIVSPIIYWNINNHFITWTYHSGRISVNRLGLNPTGFIQAFLGQVFYNNPINVFLMVTALTVRRGKPILHAAVRRLLTATGLPVIIIVTVISLFNPVLPHWSGPGFVTLSFIAAAYLDAILKPAYPKLPVVLKSSIVLILVAIFAGIIVIRYYPGTIGSKNRNNYGSGDFTLDLSGWENFEKEYNAWLQQQSDTSNYRHLKIVCNKWFPAAHIEYYIGRSEHTPVIGVGSMEDLHNFAWLNHARIDLKEGENALCIVPSNYSTDAEVAYRKSFSSVINLHTFIDERNGKTVRFFTLYLLKNYKANDEAHTINIK